MKLATDRVDRQCSASDAVHAYTPDVVVTSAVLVSPRVRRYENVRLYNLYIEKDLLR